VYTRIRAADNDVMIIEQAAKLVRCLGERAICFESPGLAACVAFQRPFEIDFDAQGSILGPRQSRQNIRRTGDDMSSQHYMASLSLAQRGRGNQMFKI
jgi:hypothetical protein